jgi:hypothetical protein
MLDASLNYQKLLSIFWRSIVYFTFPMSLLRRFEAVFSLNLSLSFSYDFFIATLPFSESLYFCFLTFPSFVFACVALIFLPLFESVVFHL